MIQSTNETPDAEAATIDLTADECLELLADERRRLTLDVLAGRTSPVDLADLAPAIVARQDGIDATTATAPGGDGPTHRVAVALHHHHLPRLDEAGLVRYDPAERTVAPTDVTTGRLPDLLDRVSRE